MPSSDQRTESVSTSIASADEYTRYTAEVDSDDAGSVGCAGTPELDQMVADLVSPDPHVRKRAADMLRDKAQEEIAAEYASGIRVPGILSRLVEELKSKAAGMQPAAAGVLLEVICDNPPYHLRLSHEPGLVAELKAAVRKGDLPFWHVLQAFGALWMLSDGNPIQELCQQAPATWRRQPPLLLGLLMLAAGLLIAVVGLVAAAGDMAAHHHEPLLAAGIGVWVLLEGAAWVAASANAAITTHLIRLKDGMWRFVKQASMAHAGMSLLYCAVDLVKAASVDIAGLSQANWTRAWMSLVWVWCCTAVCALPVGVAGSCLLAQALGAAFPRSSAQAVVGYFKQTLQPVSFVATAWKKLVWASLLYGSIRWQLGIGLQTATAGMKLHAAIMSGLPVSRAIYSIPKLILDHCAEMKMLKTYSLPEVLILAAAVSSNTASMAAGRLFQGYADRRCLLLSAHIMITTGILLSQTWSDLSVFQANWWRLAPFLATVPVVTCMQWVLQASLGQLAAGCFLFLQALYVWLLCFVDLLQVTLWASDKSLVESLDSFVFGLLLFGAAVWLLARASCSGQRL